MEQRVKEKCSTDETGWSKPEGWGQAVERKYWKERGLTDLTYLLPGAGNEFV